MSEDVKVVAEEIRGILLPVGARSLLLPNAAVAELIVYREGAETRDGSSPDWLLGEIEWRGRRIPLVSFEVAAGRKRADTGTRRARIAVLNTPSGNEALPYIGVLTLGISRLVRITPENLDADDDDPSVITALIHKAATINGQGVWIPNLDALEAMVAQAG